MLRRHVPALPLFVCLALLVCPTVRRAVGQEQQFARANCAITPPPDWENLTPAGNSRSSVVAVFRSHDRHQKVTILKLSRNEPSDRWFATWVDSECLQWDLGHKTSGRFVDMFGLKCYERRGALAPLLLPAMTFVRAIPTSEGTYFLGANAHDGKVEDAPEIQVALASFRFLRPPSPTTQSRTGSQLFHLYLVHYGLPLLMIVLLILVVIVIVGVVLRLRRHIRTAAYVPPEFLDEEPPPLPPPAAGRPSGPYDY